MKPRYAMLKRIFLFCGLLMLLSSCVMSPPPPPEKSFAEKLVDAALERTRHQVIYDGRYIEIPYPSGDVPDNIGVCTDVIVRAYRALGIDLQKEVHEDMTKHFELYPNLPKWNLTKPDPNIDHRRVYNLQIFFKRHGEKLPVNGDPTNYKPGDLVTWHIPPKPESTDFQAHIGIVVNQTAKDDPRRHLIVHNLRRGPEIEDILFKFMITGHYRYPPQKNLKQRTK